MFINKTIVISSMESPYNLPNSPPKISISTIQKMTNILQLQKLEKLYDSFIDNNMHALLLLDVIEYYLDTRDALTLRISKLKRENNLRFHSNKYILEG